MRSFVRCVTAARSVLNSYSGRTNPPGLHKDRERVSTRLMAGAHAAANGTRTECECRRYLL